MVIYLRHPVHGSKVAIADAEADADEKNGWKRFEPGDLENEVTELAKPRGRPRKEFAE